jgi:hypothetical protein
VSRLRKSQFPLPGVSKKNVPGKLNRNCSFPSGKLFAMWVLIVVLVIRQTGNIINWFLLVLRFVSLILLILVPGKLNHSRTVVVSEDRSAIPLFLIIQMISVFLRTHADTIHCNQQWLNWMIYVFLSLKHFNIDKDTS